MPSKTVAIMQPTYLPWLGYLDLIDLVDHFVFLDDVQFEKQSWQQRNKIRTPKGLEWITVPVFIKGRFGQKIKDVIIKNGKFPGSHCKHLRQNYSKARHFNALIEEFEDRIACASTSRHLCQLNIQLIDWLCDQFMIQTPRSLSSSLNTSGKRSERLVDILKSLGATEYVSPVGSYGYIYDDISFFTDCGICVKFFNYDHPRYRQVYSPFIPYASAIDLLFNEKENGLDIIRSGRKPAVAIEEMCHE